MCGRYATTVDPAKLAVELDAVDETGAAGAQACSYNVAPTTEVLAVVERHRDPGDDPTLRIRLMRWGFVPHWAKRVGDGPPLFNARAETVTSKAMFKAAASGKRCLVPMDGWFEWERGVSAAGKPVKVPFYMTPRDGSRLYMAGLWSAWRGGSGEPPVLSATILTTDAVGELEGVHDRMPLILPRESWERWLDPDAAMDSALLAPPDPAVAAAIEIRRVSTLVNSVRNDGPELVTPDAGEDPAEQLTLL
ncbi:SOS response-associated peptidase [Rhodococcus sp. D2-41]|uniref:SOS response-associated peptidase n=1 Tax=Speluncibacter jeojiensis TaxID=2710754 RepID=UPI00240F2B64|nr:SOS response-associated peptidase [Rhodococcus sp. D2-41]MDG3008775.1 SOS response-associated peptidase [Rhodococcus sp. D2-41]